MTPPAAGDASRTPAPPAPAGSSHGSAAHPAAVPGRPVDEEAEEVRTRLAGRRDPWGVVMDELAGSETLSAEEEEARAQVREGLADLRREVADLVRYESRLAVAAHRRSLMRRALDVAGPLAVAFLLLTAFVLANAAAVYALSAVVGSSGAPLRPPGGGLLVAGRA